ncbi:MAG: hypothetical protein P1U56_02415 [Saprospiraceae bacterium]|nr:hypothetical protein [Saprospiraceae bacterium]
MRIIQLQILLIVVIIGYTPLHAQHKIKMLNATPYHADQYNDAKGDPYLWKDNKEVIVFDNKGLEYNSVKGNYNGLNHEFEVYKGTEYIKLPHDTYISLKVVNDKKIDYTLFSNVHPKLKNRYCILRGKGTTFRVYESFRAKMSVVTIQTPGKPTEVKKINSTSEYYLIHGTNLIQFKLNKKKILRLFGHEKEIKKFLKENDLNLRKIEEVIQLFTFLEEQDWLKNNN